MKQKKQLIFAVLMTLPFMAHSIELPWYAGVAGGVSSLRPETQNSPFTLDSSMSFGGGAFVGYDVNKRLSFELGYNFLGNATLSGANGKTDVGYTAISASGLLYVYGAAEDIAQRDGFAGFVRLGMSSMNNRASIPLDRADNVAILAGLGIEWPFSSNMNLRAEINSFDGDAQAARLSVVYRPRIILSSATATRAPVSKESSEPTSAPKIAKPVDAPQTTDVSPTVETELPRVPKAVSEPATSAADKDCAVPLGREPVDAQGCALFSGIMRNVGFEQGTAVLTPTSGQQLNRLSSNLLSNPDIIIEIQAHTESFGSAALAKDISRQRAVAVARYLAGRGVPVQQLRARAFGHSRPLTSDEGSVGRRQNNRIALQVLSN